MIDVRDHIKALPRETLRCDSELIFIDLLLPCNRTITLGVFYRPSNDETKHLEALQAAPQHIGPANELIIVRYSNLNAFDWHDVRALNSSACYSLLLDIIRDKFQTRLVDSRMREENTLDLVLASRPDYVKPDRW